MQADLCYLSSSSSRRTCQRNGHWQRPESEIYSPTVGRDDTEHAHKEELEACRGHKGGHEHAMVSAVLG